MKLVALTIAALALASVPALAQSDLDRLKEEVEKLKVESAARAARIAELEAEVERHRGKTLGVELKSRVPAVTIPAPVIPPSAPKAPEENLLENQSALLGAMERARAAQDEALKQQMQKARLLYKAAGPIEPPPVVPASKRALEGKITAVANEIGLVVISIGKDDGVLEGDEFTAYRKGDFVAKVVIDRADRKWAAGKVILKKMEPRVQDDISNHIFVSVPRVASPAPAAVVTVTPTTPTEELRSLRRELDDVRSQVQSLTDRILPSWKDAGVTVEEASEALCSQLQIARGLVVRRVREGSPAARVLKANDVIPDRTEAQLLDVLRSGGPLPLRRQGKLEVFQVDPAR